MSRLELDEDILQLLADIRQKVVPLIAKSIHNQRNETRRLAVLNARDILLFEFGQIFLSLSWDQGMSMEEYTEFLKDLRRLQDLLEGFIDKRVLGSAHDHPDQAVELRKASRHNGQRTTSVKKSKYPKLKALMRMMTGNTDTSDLSGLLCLPATDADSQEAERTVTNFNINNAKRCPSFRAIFEETDMYPKDTKNETDKPASSREPHMTLQPHECLAVMISSLMSHIDFEHCKLQHVAKLQVRDPTGSYETTEGLEHRLFFSCGLADDQVGEKWQETTCRLVTQLPPLNHAWREVTNICETTKIYLDEERKLELLVDSSCIQYNQEALTLIEHPPIWPTLTLEDILKSDSDPLRPYDKVMLALNLSRMLLRLYSAEMKGCQWTAKDIYFLFDSSEEAAYEAYNPYLAYSLLRTTQCGSTTPTLSRKFPILVAFAQLLLEIASGKNLGPFDRRPERPDIPLLEELQRDAVVQNIIAGYVHAVRKCLTANTDNDEGAESEEMQCRAVIRDVVADLEEAWSTGYATKGDPNFPFKFRVPKDILGLRKPNKSNNAARKIPKLISAVVESPSGQKLTDSIALHEAVPTGSPTQLFDERKLKLFSNSSDKQCDWARNFLNRAEEFYTKEIKELQSEKRIRIAVLDTGVDQDNVFFTVAKHFRRKKTKPILEQKSFLTGVPVGDTFGHGTNVAALILKIAPEADLYVAKISDGQETDAADHIVEAIKWAQNQRVHIINMSFGLENSHSATEKAIRAAEGEGIICTVAASNYGGNRARAFPAKLDQVLCIHAGDGNGNKSGLDPTPRLNKENLSTLGVCIPSEWEDDVYVTGTSYAAPVAAGIAANVLRFVQHATDMNRLTPEERQEAFSLRGMRNIMLAMCEPRARDDYNFVAPWRRMWNVGSEMQHVVFKIKEALKDDM